jgi:Uma2 family endonuclease
MLTSKTVEQEPKGEVTVGDHPYLSWEEFEKEYLSREDEFKYEWVNGKVVKTKNVMYQHQYFILDNLLELFFKLRFEKKVSGKLWTEIDSFFTNKAHRRPDMAWFSDEQAARMAHRQNQVPKFIIEIVSDNDNADNLLDKLSDYADAHVEVVWLISPKLEQVHIYAGTNRGVFKGDMVCSAEPVLPEFQISANEIFKKPALPAK